MSFQVSILDSNDEYSVNGINGTITLVDYSNYDTAGESGHTQDDFSDYKKVIFSSMGGFSYALSTLSGDDEVIDPPSERSLPIIHDIYYESDDVYTVVLIAVPTWDSSVAYTTTAEHHVYYGGKLYKCILNGSNKLPDVETTYWEEVEDDDLPEKYRMEHTWSINYEMVKYYVQELQLANDQTKPKHQSKLFENIHFQNAVKLWMMLESIDIEADYEDWDRISDTITRSKTIINEL